MLVLQRKQGEIIHIGDDIEIVFLRISQIHKDKHTVHVGIKAPKNVEIWRNEVYKERQAKKEKAAIGGKAND